MYLVPVLLAVDAPDPASAHERVTRDLQERAIHVDRPRQLSPAAAASVEFDLVVYADRIELPPADDAPGPG